MSNLGGYQKIVEVVKSLGGPKRATAIVGPAVAVTGYGVLRSVEAGIRKGVTVSKAALARRSASSPTHAETSSAHGQRFVVTRDGEDGSGLQLTAGDQYMVLTSDKDAVLIEVMGIQDNPHMVAAAFLTTISDFPDTPLADER